VLKAVAAFARKKYKSKKTTKNTILKKYEKYYLTMSLG